MTSDSAGHNILTPTQPVGSGHPEPESIQRHSDQTSRALPTERPRKLSTIRILSVQHKMSFRLGTPRTPSQI